MFLYVLLNFSMMKHLNKKRNKKKNNNKQPFFNYLSVLLSFNSLMIHIIINYIVIR
nr:MAG TPA_asm: hypothetical protein [Caudoviricetes sp.]